MRSDKYGFFKQILHNRPFNSGKGRPLASSKLFSFQNNAVRKLYRKDLIEFDGIKSLNYELYKARENKIIALLFLTDFNDFHVNCDTRLNKPSKNNTAAAEAAFFRGISEKAVKRIPVDLRVYVPEKLKVVVNGLTNYEFLINSTTS